MEESDLVYKLVINLLSELEVHKDEITKEEYKWTYDRLIKLKNTYEGTVKS